MRVARYWASGSTSAATPAGQVVHRTLWRGSDVSEAAARAEVERALGNLARAVRSGQPVKEWYAYAELTWPEPLVEDITGAEGERVAAVTLNRYGATILNTMRLPFVDVDLHPLPPFNSGSPRGLLSRVLGALMPMSPVAEPRERLVVVIEKLESWVRESSARSARVYRTAAGLRYALPATELDPAGAEAASLLSRLDADPLYAKLCGAQRCYRARLSPKPWRIGVGSPPDRFKYGRDAPELDAWSRIYEQTAAGYAVCELVRTLGDAPPTPDALAVLELHDAATRAESRLPLA